jgi:Na+-transporting methylmalonyl-CoA/oxaloacetate decarboxylase gamma subunit
MLKKIKIVGIIIALLIGGYYMFILGIALLKIFIGLGLLAIFLLGLVMGRFIFPKASAKECDCQRSCQDQVKNPTETPTV